MGYAIFETAQLSSFKEKELLFEGVSEEDAAVGVIHKKKFTEDELIKNHVKLRMVNMVIYRQ